MDSKQFALVFHTEGGAQAVENRVLRRIFWPKRDKVAEE
jgi:hypothetical protein